MHPPFRRIEVDIAWRTEAEHLPPSGFRTAIDQLNRLPARSRNNDGFLALHIHQLDAMAALRDDAFDVVAGHVGRDLYPIGANGLDAFRIPEALAGGAVHAVPQGPEDVWPFSVAVLESHQHFIADF